MNIVLIFFSTFTQSVNLITKLKSINTIIMKKNILFLAFALIVSVAFAQKKDRLSAYNYWKDGKLDKAKPLIDKASEDPSTAGEAKTWLYKAYIYNDIYVKPEFKNLDPNALLTAYKSYVKAEELDTKGEYKDQIKANKLLLGGLFFNEGISLVKETKYQEALEYFQTAESAKQSYGQIDTVAIFGQAICYEKLNQTDKAISAYERLMQLKYPEPSAVVSLSNLYLQKGDSAKAEAVLNMGKKMMPDNQDITISLARFYVDTKQHEKAVTSLKSAFASDPGNVSLAYALGVTYDMLKSDTALAADKREVYTQEAINYYIKTLEIDPVYFDGLYNLGVVYYNKAVDVINQANLLPVAKQAEYDAMIAEGNATLEKALPYLEKCHELQPNDKATIVSLQNIYLRLKNMDKWKEMKDKLSKLN